MSYARHLLVIDLCGIEKRQVTRLISAEVVTYHAHLRSLCFLYSIQEKQLSDVFEIIRCLPIDKAIASRLVIVIVSSWMEAFCSQLNTKQGYHHNGDQAARRPQMMCSVCGPRFVTPWFGFVGVGDGLIH